MFVDPFGLLIGGGVTLSTGGSAALGVGGKSEAQYGIGVFGGPGSGVNLGDFAQDTDARPPTLPGATPNHRYDEQGRLQVLPDEPDNKQRYRGIARSATLVGVTGFVTNASNVCDVAEMTDQITLDVELVLAFSLQVSWGNGVFAFGVGTGLGLGGELSWTSNAKTTTRTLLGSECGCP
jgi:hypothetical protein